MFGTLFSKALELFGSALLLASFLPCLIVLLGVMLWFDAAYVLNDILAAWLDDDSAADQVSSALLVLTGIYLTAYVVYGLRDGLTWILRSGRLWGFPRLRRWRRDAFIERRRRLDADQRGSLRIPNATAWALSGFGDLDPEDDLYDTDPGDASRLRTEIETLLSDLERRRATFASADWLPLRWERRLEQLLGRLHPLYFVTDRRCIDDLIRRTRALASSDEQFNRWCRYIQTRTFGTVSTAFSDTFLFPPEEYVQPTALGNVLSWAETYPKKRYGIDLSLVYPRLQKVLDDDFAPLIQDKKTFLDFSIIFSMLCVASALFFTGLLAAAAVEPWVYDSAILADHLTFQTGGAILFWALASVCFYAVSVGAARNYGMMLHSAVDLYRFSLLEAMKIQPPTSPVEEKRVWTTLNQSFHDSTVPDVVYDVKASARPPSAVASTNGVAVDGVKAPSTVSSNSWPRRLRDALSRWVGPNR